MMVDKFERVFKDDLFGILSIRLNTSFDPELQVVKGLPNGIAQFIGKVAADKVLVTDCLGVGGGDNQRHSNYCRGQFG
jgi:hypothetical protein